MCSRISLPLYALLLTLALVSIGIPSVPTLLNYQGHLTAGDGSPLDTTVAMTFIIYDDSLGASLLWSEEHTAVTVTNGGFAVLLGSVNPVEPSVFSGETRWLGLQVGDGPMQDTLMPIVSVAYAYHAMSSDSAAVAATSLDAHWSSSGNNIYYTDGNVGIGTVGGVVSLTVAPAIRLRPYVPGMTCESATEGTIFFCDLLKELCYCDGNEWLQVDGGGSCDPGLDEGDLVITELKYRQCHDVNPWIEITNVTDHGLKIGGMSIIVNGAAETIDPHVWIEGGEALTFGSGTWCFEPDHELSLYFDHSSNVLQLAEGFTVYDVLEFDSGWTDFSSRFTTQLDIAHYSAVENDNAANWCPPEPYTHCGMETSGYYGTPGEPNHACPE